MCFTRAPVERHAFQDKVNTVKIDADGDGKETGKKYGVGGFQVHRFSYLYNVARLRRRFA